jgi:hypothetical protein
MVLPLFAPVASGGQDRSTYGEETDWQWLLLVIPRPASSLRNVISKSPAVIRTARDFSRVLITAACPGIRNLSIMLH